MLLIAAACGNQALVEDQPPGEDLTETALPSPRDAIVDRELRAGAESTDPSENDGVVIDEAWPVASGEPPAQDIAEPTEAQPSRAQPCQAGEGATDAPETIPELLRLLDSLPRPTSVPCFLESLARPLHIYATRSQLSAQPAESERSPRTFIVIGDLTLSVVPSGRATDLLEFGYRVSDERSVKGEIEFPLFRRLRSQDLVDQIEAGPGTLCGGCHTREALAAPSHFAGAFESSVIPPSSYYEIDVEALRVEAGDCDESEEPRRCAMLGALFDHGPVLRTTLWGETEEAP